MRYSPVETLRQGLAYDGKSGQWAWLLHRVSGILTVGFIVTHVLDSTLVTFFPRLYQKTIRLFKHPLAGLAKADASADKRRRALTESELTKLLETAKRRPLLEAMTIRRRKNREHTSPGSS